MVHRFRVSKEIEFDYGHRIKEHASKCSQLHGHRGKLVCQISGPLQLNGSSTGMVLDFSDIKAILTELHDMWDHGLILEETDPMINLFEVHITECANQLEAAKAVGFGKVVYYPCPPTAENLAAVAYHYIQDRLASLYDSKLGLRLEKVTFFETPTSSAEIVASQIAHVI